MHIKVYKETKTVIYQVSIFNIQLEPERPDLCLQSSDLTGAGSRRKHTALVCHWFSILFYVFGITARRAKPAFMQHCSSSFPVTC